MDGLPLCLTVRIRHDRRDRLHTHDHHEIAYVLEGTGRQVTPGRRHSVRPGQLYLFPAGTPHAARCADGEQQLLFVVYIPEHYFAATVWERDLARAWTRLIEYSDDISLVDVTGEPDLDETTRRLVSGLQEESTRRAPAYGAALRVRLTELVLALVRSRWWRDHIPEPVVSRSPTTLIREVETWIRANWYREIRVDEVLELCNLSRSHFHTLFRRYTGRTLVRYVNDIRLEQARELLTATDRAIADISEECGFSRPAYFSAKFRESFGVTPRELRRAGDGA